MKDIEKLKLQLETQEEMNRQHVQEVVKLREELEAEKKRLERQNSISTADKVEKVFCEILFVT